MRHHLTATATDSIGASSAGTSGFLVIVPVVAPPPAPPFAPCGKEAREAREGVRRGREGSDEFSSMMHEGPHIIHVLQKNLPRQAAITYGGTYLGVFPLGTLALAGIFRRHGGGTTALVSLSGQPVCLRRRRSEAPLLPTHRWFRV